MSKGYWIAFGQFLKTPENAQIKMGMKKNVGNEAVSQYVRRLNWSALLAKTCKLRFVLYLFKYVRAIPPFPRADMENLLVYEHSFKAQFAGDSQCQNIANF
jgi:hypothetical protein